jgi:hypothetical protein
MLFHGPRAVVLVCSRSAADAPAVGTECAGYLVVARFTCVGRWPAAALLLELAQVADALQADEVLLLTGTEVLNEKPPRPVVIPLPRDGNGPRFRRTPSDA